MFDLITNSDLTHLLAVYGYWTVFAIVAVESMGVPLPGEMTLMAASVYAGTTHHLQIVPVVLAAIAGAIVGDNIGYLAGRKGGTRLLRRYGRHGHLDESRLQLGQYLFERYGGSMVFFGRFVPVLRIWAGFLAGALSMPWRRFLVFNAGGAAVWATLMGVGAYTLGRSASQAGGLVGLVVGAAALLLMLALMVGIRRGERRARHAADCARHRRSVVPRFLLASDSDAPGQFLFLRPLFLADDPGSRYDRTLHACLACDALVLRCMYPPIPGCHPGWVSTQLLMMLQGGRQLSLVGRLVLEYRKPGDDPSLHFVEDHQPPERDVRSSLVARNDPGMGLDESDQLRRCSVCTPRRIVRRRERTASRCCPSCSCTSPRLGWMIRVSTRTQSARRLPSVGWWMEVWTTVPSRHSFRPVVPFACRASPTLRSLRACMVIGWMVCDQRCRVLKSGTGGTYTRQNQRKRSPVRRVRPFREWLAAQSPGPSGLHPQGARWLNLQEGWWRLFRRAAFAGQTFADAKEIEQATTLATQQLDRRAKPWIWGRPPRPHRCLCRRVVYSL